MWRKRGKENPGQNKILTSILDVALYFLQSSRGSIMFLDRDNVLRIQVARGMEEDEVRQVKFPLGTGIAGYVAQSRKACMVPWVTEDHRYVKKSDKKGITSIMSVPIINQQRVIGVMNIDNFDSSIPVIEETEEVLFTLCGLICDVVEHSYSTNQLEQKISGLVSACQTNRRPQEQDGHEQSLHWMVSLIGSVIEFDYCRIRFKSGPCWSWVMEDGLLIREDNCVDKRCHHKYCGMAERVIDIRQPMLIGQLPPTLQGEEVDGKQGEQSYLGIPLVEEDHSYGSLNLYHRIPGYYSEDDLKTATIITSLAGLFNRSSRSYLTYKTYADNVINSMSVGVISLDLEGRLIMFNRGAENLLGINPEQVVGKNISQLLPEKDLHFFSSLIRRMKEGCKPVEQCEYHWNVLGKKEMVLDLNVSLLEDRGQCLGYTIVFKDLTQQKQLEEAVRYADRLASAGQLAAGIAHEIRNPLTTVKGFSQLFFNRCQGEQREQLQVMLEEIQSMERIIEELLTFSRPELPGLVIYGVKELLEEALLLLSGEVTLHNVRIRWEGDRENLLIWTDKAQLKRSFVNIILNAIQACPGGEIVIVLERWRDEQVRVTIVDQGQGIDSNHMDKLFDPFFSTKDRGTGLGLTVAGKIIHSHGGRVEVQTSPGEGTRVVVTLPLHIENKG